FSAFGRGPLHYIFLILSIFALLFILYLFFKTPSNDIIANLSFSFIIGGAFGNIFDRAINKGVIDFIDIYYKSFHWPTFNIADSFITIGALLIILEMIISGRRRVCSLFL
ncbi:MAG: signal peptidase II, partial [Candidatus Aminicenantia bacterium]